MELNSILKKIKAASSEILTVDDEFITEVLKNLAENLVKNKSFILQANRKDLDKISKDNPIYDRILLNESRIDDMAKSVIEIANYDSPVGEKIEKRTLDNGLELEKIRTPLGVIGAIFEARPNVVIDIFALCFKSKNACVLKGGSDSKNSNEILMAVIKKTLSEIKGSKFKFENVVELLPNDHSLIAEFLKADKYVDVIIPRGSQKLIDFVRATSSIPVIETGAGVVHVYFDKFGDLEKGRKIVFNSKTTRPTVCNSLDTLLIHRARINDLPKICEELGYKKVEIRACKRSYKVLKMVYPEKLLSEAKDEDFGTEYLSLKMSIKVVDDLEEAIDHINTYGSGHSEAIVTEDKNNAEKFLELVDAACVYTNASTRFTDGGVFGLGAEVGISTQKLHARGPMGIKELTSYKWKIRGDGQIR